MSTSPDIFLSYSRDDQVVAKRFAEAFKAAGFIVWWDVTLRSGEDYDEATGKALKAAKAVVVLWSTKSVESRWVRTEATIALQRKTLMPVMVEPCERPIMFELTHTTDLSHWKGDVSDKAWQTYIGDVSRFVKEEVSQQHATSSSNRAQDSAALPRAVRQVRAFAHMRLPWLAFAAAVLVAVVLAVPAVRHLREAPPIVPPETRLDIVTPGSDVPRAFALSPDGRQIVFRASGEAGQPRLWLRSLSATSAQPLTDTDGATFPFWSPDGRSVAFFANSELRRLDLGGGAPRTLAAAPGGQGGTWNADGVIVFAPAAGAPLLRIRATGGSAVGATTFTAKQYVHADPVFLPDGRHFLFSAFGGSAESGGIYLAGLDSTDMRQLTPALSAGAYLSGWLLWVRQPGDLVAQRLDLTRQTLTGETVTIAESVAGFSVSATGLVAYRAGGGSERRQLTWFDRAGKSLGVLGDPDETWSFPSIAPDGHRAVAYRIVQVNTDLWLLDGTRTSRLTFDPALDLAPVWSPDGRSIVFSSSRSESLDLYLKAVDGSGTEQLLVTSPQTKIPTDLSRDGQFLLYSSIDPHTKADLWVRPMSGDQKPWVFLKTQFDELLGQFSPDGRFVAYQSNESGRNEIYIRPFTSKGEAANQTGGQWQVSTDGGIQPRWSPDGRELYFLDPHGRMMAVSITVTGATVASGAPVPLFPTKIFGGGVESATGLQYAVARDGRFLINTLLEEKREIAPITLIQNWQPPAK